MGSKTTTRDHPAADGDVVTGDRRLKYLPITSVRFAAVNAKEHDEAAIRTALTDFGVTIAGVVDDRTGCLVAGHGRTKVLQAMREAGQDPPGGITVDGDGQWWAPYLHGWSSASDPAATAYLIADNRVGERGGWDLRVLADVLDELADTDPGLFGATGYTADDLDDLVRSFAPPPDLTQLGKDYGDPDEDESALWPVLRMKIPPAIRNDFYALTGGPAAEADDADRFIDLICRMKAVAP